MASPSFSSGVSISDVIFKILISVIAVAIVLNTFEILIGTMNAINFFLLLSIFIITVRVNMLVVIWVLPERV